MKVTVENLPRREVVLSIEAEPDDVERYRQRAYQSLVQRAKIPGFRKGKAPLVMLERYLGKGALLEETLNRMIPDATQKAIEEQSIEAATPPSIEVSSTEPAAWTAKVALTPTVDLGEYAAVRIEPRAVEVQDQQIDDLLEDLRFQQAPWEPADRASLMGDLLTLDVEVYQNGARVRDDKGVQYRPEPGLASPVPGFAEEVVGLGAGESKEFTLATPNQQEGGESQEAPLLYRVNVVDVKGKSLAPLDDEFAKGVGDGFDDLPALREHLVAEVTAEAERKATEELRDQALDRVIEGATVEFAPSIVEHEAEHMMEQQERRLANNRVSMEEYLEQLSQTREQLMQEMQAEAERRVVHSLVLTELKEREAIEVSTDEIDEAVQELVEASGEQQARARRVFESEETRRSLERSLVTRKTLDRLVEIVSQPAESPAPEAGPDPEEETAPDDDKS